MRRNKLNFQQTLRVMRHMADVASLKGDPPAQRQLLIDGLNDLIDTDCGFFYVAGDWRIGGRPHFQHQTLTTRHDMTAINYMATFGAHAPLDSDPFCYHSIRDVRMRNSWTLKQVLPDRMAYQRFQGITDLIGATRWRDGIVAHFRERPRRCRIIGLSLHRLGQTKQLNEQEEAIVRLAVRETQRLYECGHLHITTNATATGTEPLPPRLGQIFDRLLNGRTPKAIAYELGLSLWTVRDHIQRLYRHFNVSSREELMARFTAPSEGPE